MPRLSAVLALVLASCLSSCGGSGPLLRTLVPDALVTTPLHLVVTGLKPNQAVTIRVERVRGTQAASATFRADADGRVDVTEDAPTDGAYHGVDPFGLMRSLHVASAGSGPRLELSVSVTAGGTTLDPERVVRRLRTEEVTVRGLFPDETGIRGTYFAPAETGKRRPAVLLFGGSEGDLYGEVVAGLLASRGYPSLAVGYFGMKGVPPTLERIPLEYFVHALKWLKEQPGVDPEHMVAYGVSRGSEAALLLGTLRPDLVGGVVAPVPGAVSLCGLPDCDGPAWTWQGEPVPWTAQLGTAHPFRRDAIIPVEDLDGPLFMTCGEEDHVWPSCAYMRAIVDRLAQHEQPDPVALSYDDVGHQIGSLVPGTSSFGYPVRAEPLAVSRARADAWSELLQYLEDLGER